MRFNMQTLNLVNKLKTVKLQKGKETSLPYEDRL